MRCTALTVAIASVVLTFALADVAAAKTYNASHSNTAVTSPADAAACGAAGGKVLKKRGRQMCSINYNASKSNTEN